MILDEKLSLLLLLRTEKQKQSFENISIAFLVGVLSGVFQSLIHPFCNLNSEYPQPQETKL